MMDMYGYSLKRKAVRENKKSNQNNMYDATVFLKKKKLLYISCLFPFMLHSLERSIGE